MESPVDVAGSRLKVGSTYIVKEGKLFDTQGTYGVDALYKKVVNA